MTGVKPLVGARSPTGTGTLGPAERLWARTFVGTSPVNKNVKATKAEMILNGIFA